MGNLLRRIYAFLLFSIPFLSFAQQSDAIVVKSVLHGVVIDKSSQNGLEGANVNIKGTTNQAFTDNKGSFELKTGQAFPYILHVSLVGYKSLELEVGDSIVRIELETDAQNLSDVVVVGYGTQKKITLTNAVSQLEAKDIARRPLSNIQQALQGYLPGVAVNDLGGAPGNSSTNIKVRGITTFNTNSSSTSGFDLSKNDALVIVDGAEQRMADLNPNDIESITVLKDAASTAIYGSRATNGVILVTTKTAKKGRAQVNYDGYYAWQKSNNNPDPMDIKDYMQLQQTAYANAGLTIPTKFTDSSINVWVNATDRYRYPLPNTWFQTMLHTAPQQSHSLAVSGGSDIVKSRLSVRFQDQDGIIHNYGNKIAEIRLNTEYKAASGLTFSGNIDYRYNYRYAPTVDPINNFLHGSLWAVPKYPDGTYGLSTQGNNPLMYDEIGGKTKYKNDYFTGIVQGKWNIVKGLNLSSYIAGRAYFTQGKAFTNAYVNKDSITNITKTVANNSLTETRNELREYTWNNLLTYETRVDKHHLTGLLGYSIIDNSQSYLTAYRERFYNNDIQSIGQGADDASKNNSGYDAEYALKSYFGRINYDYDGKYLLELNGRRDGSSKFTENKQYGFFPSFSAGWIVSDETFWTSLNNTVQELKLRGSYGKTGNQSVDLYSYFAALSQAGYDFNGVAVPGYRQTTLANPGLGWESTNQLDLGLDLAAFDRKLSLTVDYYRKVTNDILLNLDIPATIGLTAPYQNAGSVENKGWEFSASYHDAVGSEFHYNIGGNLSINQNKVLNLKGTGPYITGSDIDPRYIIKEGLPINTLWGYKTDGLFQTQAEIDAYGATYATGTKPGDVKYLDLNGDGKIDANDMTVIGNAFPKYTFGFNADLSYKGFELNALLQGATRVDARLSGALAEMGNQEGFTHKIYADNYWTPEHTDARFPRPVKYDLRNVASSDRMIVNGAYLRLKNIQLAYNVPQQVLGRTFITRLRFYVSATNVWTISKLNDWNLDPETPSGRATYFPQTALYTFGVNLQF